MKKEQNLQTAETQALNIPVVSSNYICAECGTEHKFNELKMADNGWDYSYYCKNCGDVIESNGTYYGR